VENNHFKTRAHIKDTKKELERENTIVNKQKEQYVRCYFFRGDDGFAARVPAKSERGEEINFFISLLLFIHSIDVYVVVIVRATTTGKNEKRRSFDNEHG